MQGIISQVQSETAHTMINIRSYQTLTTERLNRSKDSLISTEEIDLYCLKKIGLNYPVIVENSLKRILLITFFVIINITK
jgi:hypothetical protein